MNQLNLNQNEMIHGIDINKPTESWIPYGLFFSSMTVTDNDDPTWIITSTIALTDPIANEMTEIQHKTQNVKVQIQMTMAIIVFIIVIMAMIVTWHTDYYYNTTNAMIKIVRKECNTIIIKKDSDSTKVIDFFCQIIIERINSKQQQNTKDNTKRKR